MVRVIWVWPLVAVALIAALLGVRACMTTAPLDRLAITPSGELDPRAVQARLHRAVGQVQEVADLAVIEAGEVAQDHDLGQLVGQLGDRVEQHSHALAAHGVRLWVVRCRKKRRDGVAGEEREPLLLFSPSVVIDAQVPRERRDPGEKRGFGGLVAVEVLPDLEETVLRELFGLRAVVRHVPGDSIDFFSIGRDEVRPGALVPLLAAGDELGIGVRLWRHGPRLGVTKKRPDRFRRR